MEIKTITIKDKKDGETKTVSYYMTNTNVHIEDSYLIRSNETKKRIKICKNSTSGQLAVNVELF